MTTVKEGEPHEGVSLLACPFCGAAAHWVEWRSWTNEQGTFIDNTGRGNVECMYLCAQVGGGKSLPEAAALWNRRVSPAERDV